MLINNLSQQDTRVSISGLNRSGSVFGGQYSGGTLASASVFAADIVSRIGESSGSGQVSGAETAYKELGKNASKNLAGLQSSLENTINAIASRHGAEAASEVMSIVYNNVDGAVTEEGMGNGFVEAIRFIDRNYGISEGNRLMGELNAGVNKEMNEYFDNGHNEVFFDAGQNSNALRMAKGFMQSSEGLFDSLTESAGGVDLELSGAMSAKDMRKMTLELQARRMLAKGELPPAYLQEYLPSGLAVPSAGAMLDSSV